MSLREHLEVPEADALGQSQTGPLTTRTRSEPDRFGRMRDGVTITRLVLVHLGVEVRRGGAATSHRVRGDAGMVDDLSLSGVDHEKLVREFLAFLLGREPAASILPEFGLDVIARYVSE